MLPLRGTLTIQRRLFFQWLNIIFNKVSYGRIEEVGPDRACSEWLLRNGAFVKWKGSLDFVTDYNDLPLNSGINGRFFIQAVNATDASIMGVGFPHFKNCQHIDTITLKRCALLSNNAMPKLKYLENSLQTLEIISCWNITEQGILHLQCLRNLKKLHLEDLVYVKDKTVVQKLQESIPHCNISWVEHSKTSDK